MGGRRRESQTPGPWCCNLEIGVYTSTPSCIYATAACADLSLAVTASEASLGALIFINVSNLLYEWAYQDLNFHEFHSMTLQV